MVTQKDIAQNLGVSRETVKYALSGHKGVAATTRQRVLAEAARLGYNPEANQGARQMVARRNGTKMLTGVLAVLLPENQSAQYRSPYFTALMQGMEVEATERGLDMCYMALAHKDRLPRLLINGSVDGIILIAFEKQINLEMKANHIPVVGLTIGGDNEPKIVADGRQGMYLATRHLIELGHKEIGFLTHPLTFENSVMRHCGWREAMEEAGLYRPELAECSLMEMRKGPESLALLRARVPGCTAVVCYNDLVAMDVINDLQLQGLSVPQDISVTGFDDTAAEEGFSPPLTSVQYDLRGMARQAVALLAGLAAGDIDAYFRPGPCEVQLIVRSSTARPVSQRGNEKTRKLA